jgi:dCMP deaminase
MSERWDTRYIGLASHIAEWSRDPSTRVGAVIVRPNHTIASLGYNGLPRGVQDTPDRLHDRPTKLAMTVHAEVNAILSAREPLHGYTIYVHPMHPCSQCAAAIIQAGIRRVVTIPGDGDGRWAESFRVSQEMFGEAGVHVSWLLHVGAGDE